jgi:hypothetical protein
VKYVFASVLVIVALVMVFHADKIIPIPRTAYHWAMENGGRMLPFSAKVAYASACMDESLQARNEVRYKISETAVRTEDLRKESARLDQERRVRLAKLRQLTEHPEGVSQEDLDRQVRAFRRAQDQFARVSNLQTQHVTAVKSLMCAEAKTTDKINEMDDRLKLVQIEHLRHDALDMASADPDGYGSRGPAAAIRQGNSVVTRLEFDERVREDLNHRFPSAAEDDMQSYRDTDPAIEAQVLLAEHAYLLN